MAEQFNEDIKVDEAIQKYGGEDEKYKNTLKKTVRDYLGYSNYVDKMNKMPGIDDPGANAVMGGGVESSHLRGTLSAGDVNSASAKGINLRNQEMGYLKTLAKGADVAGKSSAGSEDVAVSQIEGIKTSLSDPQDYPEALMQDWIKNPTSQDGTLKTVDEFKETLLTHLKGQEAGAMTDEEAELLATETINKYIPEDVQENFEEIYYKSLGFTDSEAGDLAFIERASKDKVSDAEMDLVKQINPTLAGKTEVMKNNPGVQNELVKIHQDDPDSLTFKEFNEKYPDVSSEVVKPVYEKAAMSDIQGLADERGLSPITTGENGEQIVQPLNIFLEAETTKTLNKELSVVYQGILTSAEIDHLLWQHYLDVTSQPPQQQEVGVNP